MNLLKCISASICIIASANAIADDDGCSDVLRYSARDYESTQTDIGVALAVYEQNCQSSSVRDGTSFSAGLNAVIKAVPVKFNLGSGSTKERTEYFCKTFDSDYKSNQHYYKNVSKVVGQSTSAWLACKSLASRGVTFRPQFANTLLTVEVARTTADDVIVTGVAYDQTSATCVAPNDDKTPDTVTTNQNTKKTLGAGVWTLTCTRKPIDVNGAKQYPGFDIAVTTSKGSLVLPIAADAQMPIQWASDISKNLDVIGRQIKDISFGSGVINMVADGTRSLTDGSKCPEGNDAVRGTKNGRVTFPKPYPNAPYVGISLNMVDMNGSANRLSVNVTDIDTQGFNYSYTTWCDTKIHGSSATWVAIPKT